VDRVRGGAPGRERAGPPLPDSRMEANPVSVPAPPPWVDDRGAALFTDLYELSMLQAYRREGMDEVPATFSLFVRDLPPGRGYLLACGLDDALRFLERVRFGPEALEHLRATGRFDEEFLAWLRGFRFTGEVRAVPEGTPVFPGEPILEVTAPIAQGQLAETYVMNQVHLQTLLASKAARVVRAAAGRAVVDYGARRIHGTDAALKAARAFHVAGVSATSDVLAGWIYGVPVAGTMAHSFVQAFRSEKEAFRAFVRSFPDTVLLVDTYDTLEGVRRVVELARELGDDFRVRGVRLDSGDLAELAVGARGILDAAGLGRVEIVASGGLDEFGIAELLSRGAPIDGFGVGTRMGVSADAPALDMAYKLTEYAGEGRVKLSTGKRLLPGRKQVFRVEEGGRAVRDVLAREGEAVDGRPLLRPVMSGGERLPEGVADLDAARERTRRELEVLPERVLALRPEGPPYPVEVSPGLRAYDREVSGRAGR